MYILLRTLAATDLEIVRNWRNSESVSQFMYTDKKITSEEQLRWYERIKDNPSCKYWIIEVEGIPVGLISLTGIDQTNRKCTWAFYIGNELYLGSGLGAKVEFISLEYAFFVLNLNKITCEVLTSNPKVTQLHKRFGFQEEALFKEHIIKSGVPMDVIGLGLLRTEWETKRTYFIDTLKFKSLQYGIQ